MTCGPDALINLETYTVGQMILFGTGCFGWVVFYAVVVRNIVQRKFLEIPVASVMTNVAWEFVWGFLFRPDMGLLFVWGYRVWFFLDLVILYGLFKYGHKQIANPLLRKYLKPTAIVAIPFWAATIYFFVAQGFDTPTGLVTGYILNVIVAALYILLLLRHPNIEDFSGIVAWSKGLGTALASIFCVIVLGDWTFLLVLCAACFVLDSTYIALYTWRRRHPDAFARLAPLPPSTA